MKISPDTCRENFWNEWRWKFTTSWYEKRFRIASTCFTITVSPFWSRWSSQKHFFRSSRSKTTFTEIKRSIFGNMELGPVDFIFAAVFILNTVSFISKMLRIGLTFQWLIFSQSEHQLKASIWNFKIFIFKPRLINDNYAEFPDFYEFTLNMIFAIFRKTIISIVIIFMKSF